MTAVIYDDYQFDVPASYQVRVITNTDAKNEADDQFAIVHALLSPKLDNVGVIAAHYGTRKAADSLERSHEELLHLCRLMNIDPEGFIFRGAATALPDEVTPVPSPGADLIIREARRDDLRPLFVTFMGPLTDMASALLMAPDIVERLTVIWIGGGAYPEGGPEYNLYNDIHAANMVFGSGVRLWQVPRDVYQTVAVSLAELEHRVRPHGEIGRYLCEQMNDYAATPAGLAGTYRTGEVWCLGDSPAISLILFEQPQDHVTIAAPRFNPDMTYSSSSGEHKIRVYNRADTRFIMEDFYAKLALHASRAEELAI
jgi:purine nucleosidase